MKNLVLLVLVLSVLSGCGQVIDEFGPEALLKKYETFKNMSAELNKKKADIKIYEVKTSHVQKQLDRIPLDKQPRHLTENLLVWQQELAGIKASYNSLAAEYNAQMSKMNWRFANIGMLPEGASEPLPRSFAPYVTK